jgi:uncharacterized protein
VREAPRTSVRRAPQKGRYDRQTIDRVLDRGIFGHVAFVEGDQPFCIPMLYARVDDHVYIHGSVGSRAIKRLGAGTPACFTVTILDGLVLARSAFEHSANYESVVVFGSFARLRGEREQLLALAAFTEKLVPGRWSEIRPPSPRELRATNILALPLTEASAKRRSGPPDDDDTADAALDTWAGVVPVRTEYGAPSASPGLRHGISLADSVRRLVTPGGSSVTSG